MAGMCTLGAGEGEATWFLQNRMVLKATAETTDGAYGLVESTIAPGASPPLHIHRREDEAFYVLEGELTFRYDGEDHAAGSGTFVFLPRDVPHLRGRRRPAGAGADADEPRRRRALLRRGRPDA
jgi:quercetin dioxygenase-like cupin family protein